MIIQRLTIALGFLYFLFAGVTWVAGEAGEGAGGRVTIADFTALGLFGLWFLACVGERRFALKVPAEYRAYVPLLMVYSIGVSFSIYPGRGALELLIHVFIFVVSVVLYNLYRRLPSEEAIPVVLASILWSGGLLAFVGLVDFLVWPNLIPGIGDGLVGTFRNTGQAGAFFGVYIAILLPGFLSGLIKAGRLNAALFASMAFALLFTSKRAAVAGLLIGLALLSLRMLTSSSKRDKRYGLVMVACVVLLFPVGYLAFLWGLENIPGMAWRFDKKFNEGALEDFQQGFLAENIRATLDAMEMSPLVGVGLGNIIGVVTQKYEIHSTYMAILGTSGLLGFGAYATFMLNYLLRLARAAGQGAYGAYLKYFMPMLIGLMFSWAYTYHLRKREFWILFFVTSLVVYFSKHARSHAEGMLVGRR
ncbi:O-antigen ligase family protein [Luteimonas sp. A534]